MSLHPLDEPCQVVLSRRQMIVLTVAGRMLLDRGILDGEEEGILLESACDQLEESYGAMPA